MRLVDIFNDKSIKKIDARTMIIDGILQGNYTIEEIESVSQELKEKKLPLFWKPLKKYPIRVLPL